MTIKQLAVKRWDRIFPPKTESLNQNCPQFAEFYVITLDPWDKIEAYYSMCPHKQRSTVGSCLFCCTTAGKEWAEQGFAGSAVSLVMSECSSQQVITQMWLRRTAGQPWEVLCRTAPPHHRFKKGISRGEELLGLLRSVSRPSTSRVSYVFAPWSWNVPQINGKKNIEELKLIRWLSLKFNLNKLPQQH